MIDFNAGDAPELRPGDRIEAITAIQPGDLVCFERMAPDRVTVRALTPDEAAAYPGRTYRIEASPADRRARLRPIGLA